MAKNLFVATLLLISILGCSKVSEGVQTDSIDTYDSNSINFELQTTKATSCSIDTMESDANGFIVYGVEVDGSSWYDNMDGNTYVYDSDSQLWRWTSSEDPSWPVPFSQMNFYAYYPTSATGFTLAEVAPSYIVGDVVVAPSILDQTDFLAAASGDILAKPLMGILPLNFTHIMAKISFSVLQEEGILTIIRQLGIENIINVGSYDYINSEWYSLSNSNLSSFDDYVGSSGPFAKYGVEDQVDPIRIDGHYLMLIPQSAGEASDQTPLWDGSLSVEESGEAVPSGAYISARYRTSADLDTQDLIGYAFRQSSPNDTEWSDGSYFYNIYKKSGGSYNGPLYIKVGFKLSAEQLDWAAGTEYEYTLLLNEAGGIYLSKYYYDVDGTNTKIRVNGAPDVGDPVITNDLGIGVTVEDWIYSERNIYAL